MKETVTQSWEVGPEGRAEEAWSLDWHRGYGTLAKYMSFVEGMNNPMSCTI
jgi:hypothetical protein